MATDARERILEAACDLIASDGIDDVRIARVATKAGASTALVHHYFSTREELLEQALVHSFETAGAERFAEEPEGEPSPSRGLARAIAASLPLPGEQERDWTLWVELWLRAVRDPQLRPLAADLYGRYREWFATFIAAGLERGEFQSDRSRGGAGGPRRRPRRRPRDPRPRARPGDGRRARAADRSPSSSRWRSASRPKLCLQPSRRAGVCFLNGGSGMEPRRASEGARQGVSPRPQIEHIRRPQLLAAAAEVIAERGFAATRIADVAERAGTSAAGVLYWFESRDELLAEALTFAEETFAERLRARLAHLDCPSERLVALIESSVGGDDDWTLWIELWTRALRDPSLAESRQRLDDRWRAQIAEVVARGPGAPATSAAPTPIAPRSSSSALMDGLAVQVALGDRVVTAGADARHLRRGGRAAARDRARRPRGGQGLMTAISRAASCCRPAPGSRSPATDWPAARSSARSTAPPRDGSSSPRSTATC